VQRPVKKDMMVKNTIRVGIYALVAWLFIPVFLSGTESHAFFAAAFFAIWLGERPIDKTFRGRLLGKRRP